MKGHYDSVLSVEISRNEKFVVSGSSDNTIRIWSIENSQEIGIITGHNHIVNSVGLRKDGKQIISGSED